MSKSSPTSAACVLLALQLGASTAMAQTATERAEAPRLETAVPAAKAALPQLAPLVNEQTFRQLGFTSIEEFKSARLGTPLSVYMVRLDQLKEFTAKTKPESLVSPTNEAIFPVQVGDEVRTGMRLRNVDGKWRFSSFGASDLVKALSTAARVAGARPRASAGSQFVVTVPAFHLYFVADREPEGLMLTPAASDSRFKLEPGHAMPAGEVFAELVPYAKQYKTGQRLVD